MTRDPAAKPKPKLTDAERHKQFVEIAREVEADERPRAFDRVFRRIVGKPLKRKRS